MICITRIFFFFIISDFFLVATKELHESTIKSAESAPIAFYGYMTTIKATSMNIIMDAAFAVFNIFRLSIRLILSPY